MGREDAGSGLCLPPMSPSLPIAGELARFKAMISEFNQSSALLPAAIPVDGPYTFKCCSLAL